MLDKFTLRKWTKYVLQLEINILSESEEKDKYHMISLVCEIGNMVNLSTKQKQTHTENRLVAKEEGGSRGTDWEFGVRRCKFLHLEWISIEVLLKAQGSISNLLG